MQLHAVPLLWAPSAMRLRAPACDPIGRPRVQHAHKQAPVVRAIGGRRAPRSGTRATSPWLPFNSGRCRRHSSRSLLAATRVNHRDGCRRRWGLSPGRGTCRLRRGLISGRGGTAARHGACHIHAISVAHHCLPPRLCDMCNRPCRSRCSQCFHHPDPPQHL